MQRFGVMLKKKKKKNNQAAFCRMVDLQVDQVNIRAHIFLIYLFSRKGIFTKDAFDKILGFFSGPEEDGT